jgi:hypothetical protein
MDNEFAFQQFFLSSKPLIQEHLENIYDNAEEEYDKTAKTVRIFYLQSNQAIMTPRLIKSYLQNIPLICINGDTYILLQNGARISKTKYLAGMYPQLLTPLQRINARKKIIAHYGKMYAEGGYMSPYKQLRTPIPVIILSIAGCQFEVDYLEYTQFFSDMPSKSSIVIRGEDKYFDRLKYYKQCYEDILLMLKSFDYMVDMINKENNTTKLGYLRVIAVGMGFFANLHLGQNISHILLPIYMFAFHNIMKYNHFPNIHKIEFSNFRTDGLFTWKYEEVLNGTTFSTVNFKNSFDPKDIREFHIGIINPSDAFAIPGNEHDYASVEAMLGSNTDLRLYQSYFFNPYMLSEENYIKLK